jgi:hypothetical protein
MSISTEELIGLLRGTFHGAAPVERASLETRISMLGSMGITAQTDSEHSLFLHRTIENLHEFWDSAVINEMGTTDVYGAEIPIINAFARPLGRRRQIILLNGIQQLVLFYSHFITVLSLLMTQRADKTIQIDGWSESEAASFSLAGYSLMYHFMMTGDTLMAIGDILGPKATKNTDQGYQATIGFLLAHELGHHVLGHTKSSGTIAERNQVSLAIDEPIDSYQQMEFEADRYALMAFPPHLRASLMSSVLFFFGPMAFMEAFARPSRASHPLFTNRAAHLTSLLPEGDSSTPVVASIIQSQIEGFKRTAEMFEAGEDDIRPRIHATMPVRLAVRVVHAVKAAIRDGTGLLDAVEED